MIRHRLRLARLAILLAAVAAPASLRAAGEKFAVYVGTIGGANRIYGFVLDADTGGMRALGECAETTRPAFLTISEDHRFLYAAGGKTRNTHDPGIVRSYRIDPKTWKLDPIDAQPSEGADSSYLSIDKTGKWIFNANYQSGSIAVHPLMRDGGIGPSTDKIQYEGKGTDPSRQAAPHSHSIGVSPDNRFVLVCDLGLDRVFVYKFDAQNGKLTPNEPPYASVDPGSGARHFRFSGDGRFVYVTGEMKSTVTVFAYDEEHGELKKLQTVSMLPEDFKGTSTASALHFHPSGKWLYAANRGSDTIVRFSVDPASGLLKAEDWTPTLGKTPREFNIDPTGRWMLVGNQDSDSVQEFSIDPATGKLRAESRKFPVNHPSDFEFVPVEGLFPPEMQ
jgi:6-phosphogluconolactonase